MNLSDAIQALYSLSNLSYIIAEELDKEESFLAKQRAEKSITKAVKRAKKKVKPAEKKSGERETYTVKAGKKGRVPSWVLKQTGLANKQEVITKWGDGYTFTEGA